jgi:hypothetical protein
MAAESCMAGRSWALAGMAAAQMHAAQDACRERSTHRRHVLTATRHVVPTGLSGGIREASLRGLEKCAGVLGRSCGTTATCRDVGTFGEPRRDGGPTDWGPIRPSSRPEVASSGGPQDWIEGPSEPYGKVVRRMSSTRDLELRMHPLPPRAARPRCPVLSQSPLGPLLRQRLF